MADLECIFYQIPELTSIHQEFILALEPLVEHWNPQTEIAEVFKLLVSIL